MLSPIIKSLAVAALLGAGLSGCGNHQKEQKHPAFDGVHFRAKAKPVHKKQTLADFRVTVSDAARSSKGALAAASHQATAYCIENYGTSRFDWSNVSPDSDGAYELQLDKHMGIFLGSCDT